MLLGLEHKQVIDVLFLLLDKGLTVLSDENSWPIFLKFVMKSVKTYA